MRLQKYAQGGWNIITSNSEKCCIQLKGNEESLFVNPMDYILKLPDGYTTKSYARQQKPLLLRQQNQNSSDSVQKKTAIASPKKAPKRLSNPTGENSTTLKRRCCYDGNYREDRHLNETALNES